MLKIYSILYLLIVHQEQELSIHHCIILLAINFSLGNIFFHPPNIHLNFFSYNQRIPLANPILLKCGFDYFKLADIGNETDNEFHNDDRHWPISLIQIQSFLLNQGKNSYLIILASSIQIHAPRKLKLAFRYQLLSLGKNQTF